MKYFIINIEVPDVSYYISIDCPLKIQQNSKIASNIAHSTLLRKGVSFFISDPTSKLGNAVVMSLRKQIENF